MQDLQIYVRYECILFAFNYFMHDVFLTRTQFYIHVPRVIHFEPHD